MPEEHNKAERIAALICNPLSRRSMNHGGMGDLGTLCDISIQPGWVGIIERLYAKLEALPPERQPVIQQIKEKFGRLRVYALHVDADIDAAIAFAEGEADRSCQVCGCRGRLRVNSGWYATLCKTHHQAAGNFYREHESLPGTDDPLSGWALTVSPDRWSAGQRSLAIIDLFTGKWQSISQDRSVHYLRGLIEPACLIVALNPVEVSALLGGTSLHLRSAAEVFNELAAKHNRDQAELERRLAAAAAAQGDQTHDRAYFELRELSQAWRWLVGLDERKKEKDK